MPIRVRDSKDTRREGSAKKFASLPLAQITNHKLSKVVMFRDTRYAHRPRAQFFSSVD